MRRTRICASTPTTTASIPRSSDAESKFGVDQRTITAVCLDTGELACRHARVFARHRTITALEHARALKTKSARGVSVETPVEARPLARYDALIA